MAIIKIAQPGIDFSKVQRVLETTIGPGPYEDREVLAEIVEYHLEDLEPGGVEEIVEFFAEDGIPF